MQRNMMLKLSFVTFTHFFNTKTLVLIWCVDLFWCYDSTLGHRSSVLTRLKKRTFGDMIENAKQYDWLRNPFLCEESVVRHLPFSAQDEFIELRSDRTLELNFNNQALVDLWVGNRNEFPELFTKAKLFLFQFPTTYLCESSFSAMVIIKTKNRNRIALEGDLRITLTKIMPDIQALSDQRHAQVYH